MGVLKVRVNGVWEDISAASEPPLDEVWIGAGPPDPVGTYELWVDNTVVPPTLKFRHSDGTWQPVGDNEVHVGVEDPYVLSPDSKAELWHDMSVGQAGKLKARYANAWHPIAEFNESEVEIGQTDPVDQGIPAGTTEIWIDSSTTPPTLNAWVNGGWVQIVGAEPRSYEEVFIGMAIPLSPEVELWYDTTNSPKGVLKANNNGTWEEIGGADEVFVGNTDPYVTDPLATDELWYDTGSGMPGTLYARVNDAWVAVVNYATSVAYEQQYGQEPRAGTLNTVAREDHTHGTPPEEVSVGEDDPAVLNPDIELWYDTDATVVSTTDARLLRARVNKLEAKLAALEARLVSAGDVLDGPN